MNRQALVKSAVAALERLADADLLSLPEGRLILAILAQAVADTVNHVPGGRLYVICPALRPGSWDWWCHWLRIEPDIARAIVLCYAADEPKRSES